jgi:hypothetical protein
LSWIAGNNSIFWGKSIQYGFQYKLGTKLNRDYKTSSVFLNGYEYGKDSIPEYYDFRQDPNVIEFLRKNPIKDQGDCAASWAYSTIGNYIIN